MRIAVLGSGAVGGYYGAKLAAAGHDVSFVARGAHLQAIRARGLEIRSPLGDFVARGQAEEDTSRIGPVDLVILGVKTYHNATALPLLSALVGESTVVLSLQNGVDSTDEIAAIIGRDAVLGGSAYIATALTAPGRIDQTGVHRKVVFGEVFAVESELSARVARLRDALVAADLEVEVAPDGRVPLWEKFIYLAPFAGFTGATRLPIGPVWGDPDIRERFLEAVGEVERLARSTGVAVANDTVERVIAYTDSLPESTRSSLLIDLAQGKPIEVEALQGSVVRRGRAAGVDTPIMATLYSVLKPHAGGDAR